MKKPGDNPMQKKLEALIIEHRKDPEAFYADWCKQNAPLISSLKAKPKNELLHLLLETILQKDCLDLLLKKAQEQYEAQKDLTIGTEIIGELGLKKANANLVKQEKYHQNILDKEREHKHKDTKNLAIGRPIGVAKNIAKSQNKKENIRQVVDDLYRSGDGWKKTYSEISEYLITRNIADYKPGVMLKAVKKIAPGIKKKYDSGQ